MNSRVYILVLPTLILAAGSSAAAQAIVPVRIVGDHPPDLTTHAELVRTSLSRVEAREEFEASHSSPAAVLDADVLQAWVQAAEGALELVGLGDARGAVRELQRVGEFSASAVESLNRTATHRETVLNTCLLLVRSLLATERPADARTQVHECMRLSPMTQPDERAHPPQVIALLAEVTEEVRNQNAVLTVRSVGRQGCTVRINGVRVNETPVDLHHLPDGGEYRVQVECDQRRGRVHRVILRGRAEVVVDPRFEDTVTTDADGGLVLEYQSAQSARRHAVADALALSRVLGTEVVLLSSGSEGTQLVGVLFSEGASTVWRARLDEDFDWEEAHRGGREVTVEPPPDLSESAEQDLVAPEERVGRSQQSSLPASAWNWGIVGGLSGVSIGLGVPALVQKLREGELIGCDEFGNCRGFRGFNRNVWLPLGIVSAVSAVSAVVIGIVQPLRRPVVDITVGRGEFVLRYQGSF